MFHLIKIILLREITGSTTLILHATQPREKNDPPPLPLKRKRILQQNLLQI